MAGYGTRYQLLYYPHQLTAKIRLERNFYKKKLFHHNEEKEALKWIINKGKELFDEDIKIEDIKYYRKDIPFNHPIRYAPTTKIIDRKKESGYYVLRGDRPYLSMVVNQDCAKVVFTNPATGEDTMMLVQGHNGEAGIEFYKGNDLVKLDFDKLKRLLKLIEE